MDAANAARNVFALSALRSLELGAGLALHFNLVQPKRAFVVWLFHHANGTPRLLKWWEKPLLHAHLPRWLVQVSAAMLLWKVKDRTSSLAQISDPVRFPWR